MNLRSFHELDYKGAYEFLENVLKKHPDSYELNDIKMLFDNEMKQADNKAELHLK